MPYNARVSYLFDIANALRILHHAGIIHGDVKERNIVISPNGLAQLCDYDLAFRTSDKPRWAEGFYGTPTYSSPEILMKKCSNFPAADVYALGIIAYRMGYDTKPSWFSDLIEYKKTGDNEMLIKTIGLQRSSLPEHECDFDLDQKFLQALSSMLLHPLPDLRYSAKKTVDEIMSVYDIAGK
jgi:serine/threonine protein kinase